MEQKRFLKCERCGNIITIIKDAGAKIGCCGQPMTEIVPNTVDAAVEKHVPVATREGNKLSVAVGAVPHPMTAEHHISWIIVTQANKTQRVVLDPAHSPTAEFTIDDGPVTLYEYCNLHGLWKAEI